MAKKLKYPHLHSPASRRKAAVTRRKNFLAKKNGAGGVSIPLSAIGEKPSAPGKKKYTYVRKADLQSTLASLIIQVARQLAKE